MACSNTCYTRESIENSDHKELEPPCALVYMYMSEHQKDLDAHRAKIHALEHNLIAIRGKSNA